MTRITTIALDADDTLWQNEQFFRITQDRFKALLADHADAENLDERLIAAVSRNLRHYGFGAKGFTLSMVETALEVTNHAVPGTVIAEILASGRELLNFPVETLPYVDQALAELEASHRLILVTKGDLFDQERKLAASGLADFFSAVEIISDKTPAAYARIFERHTDGAAHTVMVGNSMRSDVLPAIAAGSYGVFVPHDLTWAYEQAEEPLNEPRYARIAHLGELAAAIAGFEAAA
ncbi:HAD family hydrolase [Devosia aquimaris]|uniref:HAD family hydrolase n=1 Tax=Devosia aquimaris TaxID=2866214 RepID=UPI001CD0BBF8|nr:HAD family hydrolase [Devosia sp. CJK-A8-3]